MLLKNSIKKVFVTGGAGFIGSHIVDILMAQGKQVTVFDNLSSGKKDFIKQHFGRKNFKLVRGDLLKINEIKQGLTKDTDLIFHLAANPDIAKGIEDPTLDFKQTIVATFNLLQVMKEKKIKQLVYFSGSGVYGDAGETYTAENFGPLLPVSMYGASKLSAEGIISSFSNLYGIKTWILRPANIIGPRATHGVIFDFINKLKKNNKELLVLGDGQQSKSYLYIDDVISAVLLALKKTDEQINLFNIASESFVTVNEVADLVIAGMGLKNVSIKHTKGKIGWPGDVPIVRIDSSKLYKLGWKPKYNSYEAVKKTIADLLVLSSSGLTRGSI